MDGNVYRAPARNAHGDAIDADGNVIRLSDGVALVGEINGIVMGGQSALPSRGRQESSDTSGQVGIPNTNAIKVQFGDRIEIDGVTYKVTSRPQWDYAHSLTGSPPSHYWLHVESTI
jgi:hypothetical protein